MNNDLMANLINTNVIKPGTELGVMRIGTSMDGSPVISHRIKLYSAEDTDGNQTAISVNANHIVEVYECGIDEQKRAFAKAHSIIDGKRYIVFAIHVKLIDHMLPEKLAKVYGFNPDGTKKKQGKKRGRKPKLRV